MQPLDGARVERLGPQHDRNAFESGVEPLDRYLRTDQRHQGKGYGRFLLADALYRSLRSKIASFAVIVDAKDDKARRFYEREGFLPLLDQPMKLYRPMADIAPLFK